MTRSTRLDENTSLRRQSILIALICTVVDGAIFYFLDVSGQHQDAAACLLDPALRLPRILFFFGQVADRHVRAFAREGDRHGAADAAVAAGDQGNVIGQAAEAFVRMLAVIGARRHLRVQSGWIDRRLRVVGARALGFWIDELRILESLRCHATRGSNPHAGDAAVVGPAIHNA